MRIICNRRELGEAIKAALAFTDQRGNVPIMAGLLLACDDEYLAIRAHNNEAFFSAVVGLREGDGAGQAVVSARLLHDIVHHLEGEEVTIYSEESFLVINREDNAEFKLATMPTEDFPAPPEITRRLVEGLPADEFLYNLERVSRAAAIPRHNRPYLEVVKLEFSERILYVVATDSYRMAVCRMEVEAEGEWEFCVPTPIIRKAQIIAEAKTLSLSLDEAYAHMVLSSGGRTLWVRLGELKFPQYRKFFPEACMFEARVDKREFQRALKSMARLGKTIELDIGDGIMHVRTTVEGVGKGDIWISAEHQGQGYRQYLNAEFLLDGVSAIRGEKVCLGFNEPNQPVLITGADRDDYKYLLMPIRVDGGTPGLKGEVVEENGTAV